MNDFGEMSATGVVLSNSEMKERRLKRGECLTCGIKCFKKTLFKSTPISVHGKVFKGRCLQCRPLDPSEMASLGISGITLQAQVEIASEKDLKRAQIAGNRSMGNLMQRGSSPRSRGKGGSASAGYVHSGEEEEDLKVDTSDLFMREKDGSASTSPPLRRMPSNDGGSGDGGDGFDRDTNLKSALTSSEKPYPNSHEPDNIPEKESSSVPSSSLYSRSLQRRQSKDSSRRRPRTTNTTLNKKTKEDGRIDGPIFLKDLKGHASAAPLLQRSFRNNRSSNRTRDSATNNGTSKLRSSRKGILRKTPRYTVHNRNSMSSTSSMDKKPAALNKTELEALEQLGDPDCTLDITLKIAKDFPQNTRIQQKAMDVFSKLSTQISDVESNQGLFQREDGMKLILSTMDDNLDNEDLLLSTCAVLRNSSTTKRIQELIGKHNGIQSIMKILDMYPDNEHLQSLCMECLGSLGRARVNEERILRENGDKRIVAVMIRHNDSSSVQETCLDAISELSQYSSFQQGFVAANGAGQIAIAMVMFSDNLQLLEKAFCTLRGLCSDSDDNKYNVARSPGVVDAIVSTMQLYRDNPKVQSSAAWTLGGIGSFPPAAVLISENGGVDVIARAMYLHEGSQSVAKQSCYALEVLSAPENKTHSLMVEIGVIGAVVHVMQANSDNPSIQASCCMALSNLAKVNTSIKKKIVEKEALDSIAISMVMHGEHRRLQQNACSVLCNLLCDATFESLLAAGATELMHAASTKFPAECREPTKMMMNKLELLGVGSS